MANFVKLTALKEPGGDRWVNLDRVREIRRSESMGLPAGGSILVYEMADGDIGGRCPGEDHVTVVEPPEYVAAVAS